MALTNYARGRNKEYRIMRYWRGRGCLAIRSAGSHTPVDVIVINPYDKIIKLIQSKLHGQKNLSERKRNEIIAEGSKLEGDYKVLFEIWD